jgi:hypothetical protein
MSTVTSWPTYKACCFSSMHSLAHNFLLIRVIELRDQVAEMCQSTSVAVLSICNPDCHHEFFVTEGSSGVIEAFYESLR